VRVFEHPPRITASAIIPIMMFVLSILILLDYEKKCHESRCSSDTSAFIAVFSCIKKIKKSGLHDRKLSS
jgi:hypothetical protein